MWGWRAAARRADEISLFPLNAVLFPGGLLTLKVFDSRYLDLLERCMQDKTHFGVVALKPREAHGESDSNSAAASDPEHESQAAQSSAAKAAPRLEPIGVLAEPLTASSLQAGILQVRCRGLQRFELGAVHQRPDGLWQACYQAIAEDASVLPQAAHLETVRSLATAIQQLKAQDQHPFLKPYPFNQAGWVANRWCEILPISVAAKQRLMELRDPLARLDLVGAYLRDKGVVG
jgi:uncharacterized protein